MCVSGDISDRPDRYPFEVHLNCVLVYTARISRVPPQDFTDIICSVRNVAGASLPDIGSVICHFIVFHVCKCTVYTLLNILLVTTEMFPAESYSK